MSIVVTPVAGHRATVVGGVEAQSLPSTNGGVVTPAVSVMTKQGLDTPLPVHRRNNAGQTFTAFASPGGAMKEMVSLQGGV